MSKIILVGSPNSGKSLLFNRLTGLQHKVGNFPGITVDVSSGNLSTNPEINLVDFPGTYSLQSISGEEQVAVDQFYRALTDPDVAGVACVLDITRLEKSLFLASQMVRECARHQKPLVILANMYDVLQKHGMQIDLDGLSDELGAPVIALSARSGLGINKLHEWMASAKERLCEAIEFDHAQAPNPKYADTPDEILRGNSYQLSTKYSPKGDLLVKSQARLDSFFLHSVTGGISFFVIMYLLFQSIFTWSGPAMDAVEGALAAAAGWIVPLIPNQIAADFVADALFSGVGAFLVFVPQIFILTFIIGLLEDSGYMARAALICHKPLRLFGLTGKSFIPLLSGVACAIPGIYASRAVDSPKKRRLTYMAVPLMPCSARLPVYLVLIAAFLPQTTALGGLIGWQGLAMTLVYLFGLMFALLVTGLISRFSKEKFDDLPFILEMPPYRLPGLKPLLRHSWNRSKHFVTKAGGVIFMVTAAVWFLGYFPNQGEDLTSSWLAQIGQFMEPVFEPLGLDWRYGVAIISSLLAREVFVGVLGTMFGIEGAEENMVSLVDTIQASNLPLGSGLALLVFFSIALMCISTMAILRKESNSNSLVVKMFIGYGLAAYAIALGVFQLAQLLS
ncbi:MAG: ferrous iron transport protein B [Candidatus Pelagadaptatus aseana]|uniref:ferrous iron transporter B n=1 Tax=Candidatus Pelagadaptatus aseana TaxID=3120508 RepID=UPI0039B19CF4